MNGLLSLRRLRGDMDIKRLQDAFAPFLQQGSFHSTPISKSSITASSKETLPRSSSFTVSNSSSLGRHGEASNTIETTSPAGLVSPSSILTQSTAEYTAEMAVIESKHVTLSRDSGDLARASHQESPIKGTCQEAPHPPSFDAIMHYIYTNNQTHLIDILKKSDDHVFGVVRNAHFLGQQAGDMSQSAETDIYNVVSDWVFVEKLTERLIMNPAWNRDNVPACFLIALLERISRGAETASMARRRSMSLTVHANTRKNQEIMKIENAIELEKLKVVLLWLRRESQSRGSGFRVKNGSVTLRDLMTKIDFSKVPEDQFVAESNAIFDMFPPSEAGEVCSNEDEIAEVLKIYFQHKVSVQTVNPKKKRQNFLSRLFKSRNK